MKHTIVNVNLKTRIVLLLVASLLLSGCVGRDSDGGDLTIAGSTTVQPIVTKAAEVYLKEHPEAGIGVQGGGSGTGIRLVGEGSIAIGASSRELKAEELEEHPDLVLHRIAIDCIVVVVHPDNPVDDLTLAEVRDIFLGRITNYRELGGPDLEIVLVQREDGSGTRSSFESLVLDGREASDAALQKSASGAIRFTVSENLNAIGYVGLGYLDGSVKPVAINGVLPAEKDVQEGRYPLARDLYLVTKNEPEGLAGDFIGYILSDEGQEIVREEGFVRIR